MMVIRIHKRTLVLLIAVFAASLLAVVGCAANGGGASGGEDTSEAVTSSPTATVTEAPSRSATIQTVEGTVEVETAAGAGFAPASAGQVLTGGASMRTGEDGRAVVLLDDATSIVVAENSSFTLAVMEGSPQTPLTRLFLAIGQVFSATPDPLPEGASYEIETPNGVATIRGSLMGVGFDPEGNASEITCLAGTCLAVVGEEEVEVPPGMQVDLTEEGIGEVGDMSDENLENWGEVLNDLDDAGVPPPEDEIFNEGCSCVGTDLVCEDGTTTPFNPLCTGIADCACDGTNLVCTIEGETFSYSSPLCGGELPCSCVGTDMVCTFNGETFSYPAPECGGEFPTCTCVGEDLVCTGQDPIPGGCAGVPELPPVEPPPIP